MTAHDSVPGIHTGVEAQLHKTVTKSYAAAEIPLLLQNLHKTTFLAKKRFELERQRKSERRVEWASHGLWIMDTQASCVISYKFKAAFRRWIWESRTLSHVLCFEIPTREANKLKGLYLLNINFGLFLLQVVPTLPRDFKS